MRFSKMYIFGAPIESEGPGMVSSWTPACKAIFIHYLIIHKGHYNPMKIKIIVSITQRHWLIKSVGADVLPGIQYWSMICHTECRQNASL